MPAVLWAIVIMVLLALPPNEFSEWSWRDIIPFADKWMHAGLFGVLAFLLAFGLTSIWQPSAFVRSILMAALISGLYGIATEFLQAAFFTGRKADVWDAVADLAGVFAGIGVFLFWWRFIRRKRNNRSIM
jgi:VanZ family protein